MRTSKNLIFLKFAFIKSTTYGTGLREIGGFSRCPINEIIFKKHSHIDEKQSENAI